MATVDLFTLIFEEILKIAPNILYKYGLLQDQVLYLIFIPHVVLFLFIQAFGMGIVPPKKDKTENKGLRYLVMITAYIFIIYQGWYGSILVSLMQTWFEIILIFGLVVFFLAKIFPPWQIKQVGDAAGNLGAAVGISVEDKSKARKQYKKALADEQKALKDVNDRLRDAVRPGHVVNPNYIANLQLEKQMHENRIKELKKLAGF